MPIIGGSGVSLLISVLISVLLTAVGLGLAKLVRSIDIEDIGTLVGAVIAMTVVGWAVSFVWPIILAGNIDRVYGSGFSVVYVSLGVSFVTNTLGLAVASLVVSGLKIRGFVGLLVAAFVVTAAEQSFVLIQLAQGFF